MKTVLFTLLLSVVIGFKSFAQQSLLMNQISEKLSVEINKLIKRSDLGTNPKIAITMFSYDNNITDTLKTILGIRFAESLAHSLMVECRRSEVKILFPENTTNSLDETMRSYFTPPTGAAASEYWAEHLNELRPDYYISANIHLSENAFSILNLRIIADFYRHSDMRSVALEDQSFPITAVEYLQLLKLAIPIGNEINNSYLELINLNTTGSFMKATIVDERKQPVTPPLDVAKYYQIEVNLTESAYLYAFYYDPQDKENPFISMIHPYLPNSEKMFSAGKFLLPENTFFEIMPPAVGKIFIQVIAAKKPLGLIFSSETDSEGYILTFFKQNHCNLLLDNIKAMDKSEIAVQTIVYERQ